MAQLKNTPGVYVEEVNAHPDSVVQVPTAIPAFIGYTEKALWGAKPLDSQPIRIGSCAEFSAIFGGPPSPKVRLRKNGDALDIDGIEQRTRFFLHGSMRLYFDNGGGPCWVVSVGSYEAAMAAGKSGAALHEALRTLETYPEPTMIVIPDAVLLESPEQCTAVAQEVLAHCAKMQSRIGILDVYEGNLKRTHDPATDVISGATGLRSLVSDFLNYGVAYYPWLNTSLTEEGEVDYGALTDDGKTLLASYLKGEAARLYADMPKPAALEESIDRITAADDEQARRANHDTLAAAVPAYKTLMVAVRTELDVMPPSAAMAGVYVRIDHAIGVHKAPANTGIASAVSPTVAITHEEQEDLSVPLNGMAVNAIRMLPGRGLLIWGARTLDANSQDWRYVNVRRTVIMLEQSIKTACQSYAFEANDALTWSNVRSMIGNFLANQWKVGVLIGAKPEDAFSVDVGLGSTMTANDLLDGYMQVVVKVSIVRPAEFIDIRVQQPMPKF
ncbi:MAG: phage tail sheath family protein [Janthinobacterium lividum]